LLLTIGPQVSHLLENVDLQKGVNVSNMKRLKSIRGVLLIICLILLVVIAGLSLTVVSISTTNNKAAAFSSTSLEAQQKADAIANFVYSYLNSQNQILDDITTCSPSNSCLVWNSQPGIAGGGSMVDTKSNTTVKQWWYANTRAYPNATQLHAFTSGTYANINGSQVTDPIANYAIIQDGTTTDSNGYNVRSLRIIAYSTDKDGKTAAVRQIYYPWVARCKSSPSTITSGHDYTSGWQCTLASSNSYTCVCLGLSGFCACGNGYYGGNCMTTYTGNPASQLPYYLTTSYRNTLLAGISSGVDPVSGWNCSTADNANYKCTCTNYCGNGYIGGDPGTVYNTTQQGLTQYLSSSKLSTLITRTCRFGS
jgi:Tfp pilus assembly protein PilX